MDDVVERVLRSFGKDDRGSRETERVRNYLRLFASTCRTDEQLFTLGKDYLREILEPDPRYSGC
jgi:hypothetical protein